MVDMEVGEVHVEIERTLGVFSHDDIKVATGRRAFAFIIEPNPELCVVVRRRPNDDADNDQHQNW